MPDETDQHLIRVKADATGVDLSLGRGLPDLLGRLLPTKFQIRRATNKAIAERILDGIRANSNFDEAELAFAEDMLSEQAKKYVRLKHVQTRAHTLFEENPPVPLIGSGDTQESTTSQTSDDWVNKFREDASLVDDELVREIYARVLAEEARRPAAFSLRTLAVLRYLDREAATAFGLVQKVLINGLFVPQQLPNKDHILNLVGLNHTTMLMLEDAGLVYSSTHSESSRVGDEVYFVASGYRRILVAHRADNAKFTAKLNVHLLTPAGKQLAQIAEGEPDESMFLAFVEWLRSQVGNDAKFQQAALPSRDWSGSSSELTWQPVASKDTEEPLPASS